MKSLETHVTDIQVQRYGRILVKTLDFESVGAVQSFIRNHDKGVQVKLAAKRGRKHAQRTAAMQNAQQTAAVRRMSTKLSWQSAGIVPSGGSRKLEEKRATFLPRLVSSHAETLARFQQARAHPHRADGSDWTTAFTGE